MDRGEVSYLGRKFRMENECPEAMWLAQDSISARLDI
jgi:hypothetical protein